ncbi:substrate-binding domain-containing protein [uncultured Clostridium sp.]|uniref:substrate-binding domain-containing protein n=1 Tax=uncultured Clostridium sp. TaxID=59620 RepID=UPI002639AC56|nr:substrate-binding domain-containing protein [uncultured Clostridium sp.]
MRRRRVLIIAFVLAVISVVFFINETIFVKEKRALNISIITRGEKVGSFLRVKNGIDRIKEEKNIKINIINLSKKNNKEEQRNLLKEELDGDCDAILISPIEYEVIKEDIEKRKRNIPIIILETKIDELKEKNSNIINIPYDNKKIGYKLGDEIMSRGHFNKNILVLLDENIDYIEERKEGFLESIKITDNNIEFIKKNKSKSWTSIIQSLFKDNRGDIIVSFDMELLEEIARIKEENFEDSKIEIYGVGTNDYIISALEKRIINGFSMQNEFNMGYLGVKAGIDLIEKKEFQNVVIDSKIINNENMYYDYNQKILFPFIN